MAEQLSNLATTTLSAGINNSVTSIPVASSALPFPQTGDYRIQIGTEILLVTAVPDATHFTATRGAEGTTAASHLSGDAVSAVITKASLEAVFAKLAGPSFTGTVNFAGAVDFDGVPTFSNTALTALGVLAGFEPSGTGAIVQNGTFGPVGLSRGAVGEVLTSDAQFLSHSPPTDYIDPRLNVLKAWTASTDNINSSTAAMASGTAYFLKTMVPYSMSVTNIVINIQTAGATLTSSGCFAGIYSSAGSRLGTTADQAANWVSGGEKVMAITGGPITVVGGPGVWVYICLFARGTTGPSPNRTVGAASGQAAGINMGTSAAAGNLRVGTLSGQTYTALPATVTLTGLTSSSSLYVAGLS